MGMSRHARNAFATEVQWQCQIGTWAFEQLKGDLESRRTATVALGEFLDAHPEGVPATDQSRIQELGHAIDEGGARVLMDVQTLLVAAGIVAEIFWPSLKRGTPAEIRARERRSEFLLRWMRVPEDSYLKILPWGPRDLRGGIVHIDEVIDATIGLGGGKRIERFGIGPADMTAGYRRHETVRWLDDDTLIFSVGSREADLGKLADAMHRQRMSMKAVSRISFRKAPGSPDGTRRIAVLSGTAGYEFRPPS